MNIELRFLQKAIEDKNYVNFTYENKKYTRVQPIKLICEDLYYYLHLKNEVLEFKKIKKLQISKEKF